MAARQTLRGVEKNGSPYGHHLHRPRGIPTTNPPVALGIPVAGQMCGPMISERNSVHCIQWKKSLPTPSPRLHTLQNGQ